MGDGPREAASTEKMTEEKRRVCVKMTASRLLLKERAHQFITAV